MFIFQLRHWREQQMEALMIQHKIESEKLEAARERVRLEAELEAKKRSKEKEEVSYGLLTGKFCTYQYFYLKHIE